MRHGCRQLWQMCQAGAVRWVTADENDGCEPTTTGKLPISNGTTRHRSIWVSVLSGRLCRYNNPLGEERCVTVVSGHAAEPVRQPCGAGIVYGYRVAAWRPQYTTSSHHAAKQDGAVCSFWVGMEASTPCDVAGGCQVWPARSQQEVTGSYRES
jgi:hypothetical protein